MPKISFVIPCYNKVAYIADCMQSLIEQTLKDIEIIVVNDHSTDGSKEVLDYFRKKDKRVKVYNLPQNKGRSYARNYGNRKANSPIICVQDADDAGHRNRARVTHRYFNRHKDIDVIYSSFHVVDKNNNILGNTKAVGFNIQKILKDGITYICHSTMAYRKKAVLDIKYSDGNWSNLGLDDWKLQMDMYKEGYGFGHIAVPLVLYREMEGNIVLTRNLKKVQKIKQEYLERYERT